MVGQRAFLHFLLQNSDHYDWFLDHLKKLKLGDVLEFGSILNSKTTVIFSDRQKGLAKSVRNHLPLSNHLPCCHHLLDNCQKISTRAGNKIDSESFWYVQRSKSEGDFQERLTQIRRKGFDSAAEYLEDIKEKWTLFQHLQVYAESGAKTYGIVTRCYLFLCGFHTLCYCPLCRNICTHLSSLTVIF